MVDMVGSVVEGIMNIGRQKRSLGERFWPLLAYGVLVLYFVSTMMMFLEELIGIELLRLPSPPPPHFVRTSTTEKHSSK